MYSMYKVNNIVPCCCSVSSPIILGHRSPTFAVRETDVSRHQGGPIEGPPETPRTSVLWCTGGFRGALNWAPLMPRDVSLSDSKCLKITIITMKKPTLALRVLVACAAWEEISNFCIQCFGDTCTHYFDEFLYLQGFNILNYSCTHCFGELW